MNRHLELLEKSILINKFINRPIASLIVKVALSTGITPNQLTVCSFFLGVIGAFFLVQGKVNLFIFAGIFIQVSSIMDCADGMLARAKQACTDYGAYLDIFLDRVNEFFILTAYAIGLYRFSGKINLLILSFVSISLYFLHILLFYVTKKLLRSDRNGDTNEARALLLFLIFVFAVFNRLDIGVYVFLTSTLIVNLYLIVHFILLGRELKRQPKKR